MTDPERRGPRPLREWEVKTLDDAERLINMLHRRSIRDIDHINHLYDRIAWLERPWWRRIFKKAPYG